MQRKKTPLAVPLFFQEKKKKKRVILHAMVSHSPPDRLHGNADVQLRRKIFPYENIRRWCSNVIMHWPICQDSWFPENQHSIDFSINCVALKLLIDN